MRPGAADLCGASSLRVASYNLHFGEEPPITGKGGSGTIFFSGCPVKCIFCQNYPISHLNNGREVSVGELSEMMLELQGRGASNINLVTPGHFTLEIREALLDAGKKGLKIPVVYNSSGYDGVASLKTLEGLIDVYMPDVKFAGIEAAHKYCEVPDYSLVWPSALAEMKRQVGGLVIRGGEAVRGLLVRHLVLPGETENSKLVLEEVYKRFGNVFLSLMSQYHPCFRAVGHPVIGRRLLPREYREVLDYADKLGFDRGYRQFSEE